MKRNTPEHWKMDELVDLLQIGLAQAVGHIELLFHLTSKQAIHGNIGKMSNSIIARKCGWTGDHEIFVKALIKARWVDECIEQRLIVHDWHEHCDDATRKAVQRSGIDFFRPKTTVSDSVRQCPTEPASQSDKICLPSLAKPSLAKPEPEPSTTDDNVRQVGQQPTEILNHFPEHARQPALQAAIAYQTRRYGSPNPSASWYCDLLREAATVFEVTDNPEAALDLFIAVANRPASKELPRSATFSDLCLAAGIKLAKPPPWKVAETSAGDNAKQRLLESLKQVEKRKVVNQ